jgi:hypothetical protein
MTDALGAAKSECTAGRNGYRSGYYGRSLIRRVGKLELRLPQDRTGQFSTESLRALSALGARIGGGAGERNPAGTTDRTLITGRAGIERTRLAGKKALRRKTEPRKAKPTPPLRKEMGNKTKSNKLVCRYCGSDDLAPSFIKRRDRRKCFGKRWVGGTGAEGESQEVVWAKT